MECPFQVGDEVVCVDAAHHGVLGWEGALTEGRVYIVEAVEAAHPDHPASNAVPVIVVLVGVQRPFCVFGTRGFDPSRFRKVQKPRTTIEQFTRVPVGDTNRWDKSRRAPVQPKERV